MGKSLFGLRPNRFCPSLSSITSSPTPAVLTNSLAMKLPIMAVIMGRIGPGVEKNLIELLRAKSGSIPAGGHGGADFSFGVRGVFLQARAGFHLTDDGPGKEAS